jgi:hypothetical protein
MVKKTLISMIVLSFLIFELSGCMENTSNPTVKFYGSWKTVGSFSNNETWTFYSNGTVKNVQNQVLDEVPITSIVWFNYTVNDDDLCFSSIDVSPGSPSYYSECFGYQFSDTANRVTLSFNGTTAMIFAKVS